jgi:hypothetical protein
MAAAICLALEEVLVRLLESGRLVALTSRCGRGPSCRFTAVIWEESLRRMGLIAPAICRISRRESH